MATDTLVYKNGGDYYTTYNGITNPLSYWRELGRTLEQSYMYKGFHHHDGEKHQVVVYSNERWDGGEIAKRKYNGFLGIREYQL